MKLYLYSIIILVPLLIGAQIKPVYVDSLTIDYHMVAEDSIPWTIIDLDEVLVLPRLKLVTKDERLQYLILKRKTLKVYPYAKLAAERLVTLQQRLKELPKRRQQKKYAKVVQNYIEDEFSAELKKLTKTEGQILVKLIHRQTGKTTFQLIKELRNGWRAFWFNNTAKLFNISLKREFSPLEVKEDYLIEDILLRSFQSGTLEQQAPAFEIDYYDLVNRWKNTSRKKRASVYKINESAE